MKLIKKTIIGLALGSGIVASSMGIQSLVSYQARKDQEVQEMRNLVSKAVDISSGEDRTWSTQEKKDFLHYFGITTSLHDNQDVRLSTPGVNGASTIVDNTSDVIIGNEYRNNGWTRGATSGTCAGKIHKKDLIQYISDNSKK